MILLVCKNTDQKAYVRKPVSHRGGDAAVHVMQFHPDRLRGSARIASGAPVWMTVINSEDRQPGCGHGGIGRHRSSSSVRSSKIRRAMAMPGRSNVPALATYSTPRFGAWSICPAEATPDRRLRSATLPFHTDANLLINAASCLSIRNYTVQIV